MRKVKLGRFDLLAWTAVCLSLYVCAESQILKMAGVPVTISGQWLLHERLSAIIAGVGAGVWAALFGYAWISRKLSCPPRTSLWSLLRPCVAAGGAALIVFGSHAVLTKPYDYHSGLLSIGDLVLLTGGAIAVSVAFLLKFQNESAHRA